jgi:hypothetical protein
MIDTSPFPKLQIRTINMFTFLVKDVKLSDVET